MLFTEIAADCGGETPQIECSCCIQCCDDSTGECALDVGNNCQAKARKFGHDDQRSAQCECSQDDLSFSCTDTACQSCSLSGHICAVNKDYGYTFDESGAIIGFHNTLQYVSGRNETILFESGLGDSSDPCRVAVDGEQCRYCHFIDCRSDFRGFLISCDNLEEGHTFNSCDETFETGFLEVFFLYDASMVNGCPLLLERI